ncbi:AAA family ATPase [Cardiobacterium hominis]|uniref:AAA family ATPase n=1 Tax=Cardiobacterium hominis TaxID=2718 RepID=UPI002490574F|nr:AAA family ATPase [Cardiobacterium hominis]
MRIHTIRLANLNALTGTWEIDLDHPAYSDNIYALTGPTGAGKTTILDAISLALYGRTPRLARIGKTGNEIMSRHSGTCHAEITFSTRTGRYRSHWSQHRARRKAGGELQNPKHELADADSGELLATGLKDVAAAIERLTGMDYQRFTRAMLLAQGDFAAFLRAAPDERAPLLEQITGTEIYSRISIAVHERLRDALEQQRQLATETAGITPLDAATHTALTQESAALQKQLAALTTRQQQTAAALARAQNIAELTAELARLDEQHTAHQAALARFAPERERLAAAQSAALLDADYARLDTLRRAQQQNRAALAALDEQAPALARTHETANQALTAASARVHSEKQRLAAAQPRWQQTRAYDHTLRHQREQLATLEQRAAAHTAAQTALAAAEKYAAAARENSARADVARKKTETALAAHLQGRLLREYRAEKDNILRELAYHQRIADLEQQRAHLHDGEPCPLCGATEHPYASELPAQPDDLTARLETLDTYIKRAETLGEQHENAQRALASAREKQQQTENTLALAAEKARNSAVHAEQHAALQQTHAQTLAARQALLANRDPDAEETAQQHAIAEAEGAMEKARDTCQTAQTAAAANQQQRAQLHARLTAQQQELQTAEQQFAAALKSIPVNNPLRAHETETNPLPCEAGEGTGIPMKKAKAFLWVSRGGGSKQDAQRQNPNPKTIYKHDSGKPHEPHRLH